MMTQTEMGEALGIGQTAVSALVRRGMPLTSAADAAAWRAANMRRHRIATTRAIGTRGPQVAPAMLPESNREMTRDLLAARLLREQSDARSAQLKLAETEGRLMDVDKMRSILARSFIATRDTLLSLCDRLAPVLAAETDQQVCWKLLFEEHHRALTQLAKARSDLGGEPDERPAA